MTNSERYGSWDVVAVPFPYADRLAEKRRPALVVSRPALLKSHGLVWVVMITSAENAPWDGDMQILDLTAAGLPAASVIRAAKIAVIDASRIARRIGSLAKIERATIAARLRANLA